MNSNTDDARVGANVRRARLYRGMTLEQLSGRVGKSKGWLSAIENGRWALQKRQDVAAIAEVLQVSADTLLGQPAPELQRGMPERRLEPLRAVLLDAALDDPQDIPARPVSVLGALNASVDEALRVAGYDMMQMHLPGLIGELQVRAGTGKGPERDEALRLLIQACASATIMLRHFGRTDLAWVSADRGRQASVLLGDPVWRAAAAYECAHARPSAGLPAALLAMPRAADELEPLASGSRLAAEVYGMLRLSAALSCAVRGDHAGAEEQGSEAARVAAPLGDAPDAFELFGVANVGVWRTSLAVEAGNAEIALARADEVQPRALASKNRRAALSLERGRAFAMLGNDSKAVAAFRHAERLSPAQVRSHPLVREEVGRMMDSARHSAGGRDLQGLAWRMGVSSGN